MNNPFTSGGGSGGSSVTVWTDYAPGLPTAAATGVDTITATYSPAVTLTNGTRVILVAAGANTGAVTFAPNSLTAKAIVKVSATALAAGDIPGANYPCDLEYNGTAWVLLNPALSKYAPLASPTFTGTVTLPVGLTGIPKVTNGEVSIATVGSDYSIPITPSPADGAYSGTPITGKNGEAGSMAFGDVVYCANGATNTVPTFKLVKGDATGSNSYPAVAMCMETITSGNTGVFLLCGFVQNTGWGALTVGGAAGSLWMSITGTTGNTWTQTEPLAAGNISQYLGFAVNDAYSAAHTGQSKTIFFNPIPVWAVK